MYSDCEEPDNKFTGGDVGTDMKVVGGNINFINHFISQIGCHRLKCHTWKTNNQTYICLGNHVFNDTVIEAQYLQLLIQELQRLYNHLQINEALPPQTFPSPFLGIP